MKSKLEKRFGVAIFLSFVFAFANCGGGGSSSEGETSGSTSAVLANAGSDRSVEISADPIVLDGTESTGVETAEWSFYALPDGSAAAISNASSLSSASFVADLTGTYSVKLSVNGGESEDVVNISVVSATDATARITADDEVLRGNGVTLDGSSSAQVSTAQWEILSRPAGSSAVIADASAVTTSFVPDVAGDYEIQLSINGGVSSDTATITAKNLLAVASVPSGSSIGTRTRFGIDEYVLNFEESGATVSASASQVASGAAIVSYEWEQIAGPQALTADTGTSATYTFSAPDMAAMQNASDRYKWQVFPISRLDTAMRIRLTIRDDQGNTDSDVVEVYLEDAGQALHTLSGLKNIPRNAVIYLSGPTTAIDGDGSEVAVTDWTWTLSSGTFLDSGSASSTRQFPSLTLTATSAVTVSYSSQSGGVSGSFSLKPADFVGVGIMGGTTPITPQCGSCHMNGVGKFAIVKDWEGTRHSTIFEESMDLYSELAPEPYLWEFNTVAYDTVASNNGFDDRAAAEGFTMPETELLFDEFAATYPNTATLSTVQCENCHGPGSKHAGDKNRIARSVSQFGVCAQCHVQEGEWKNSIHHSTGVKEGDGSYQSQWLSDVKCVRCHTGKGFADYVNNGMSGLTAITESEAFPGVTCGGCHDPHDATNYKQLRVEGQVAMNIDGSTVTAGRAGVCYTCHDGFYQYGQSLCDTDNDGAYDDTCTAVEDLATGYYEDKFHFNSQAVVFEGKGALRDLDGDGDDDFTAISNSYHATANFIVPGKTENVKCVTCHMATGPSEDEDGYQRVGGHSFAVRNADVQLLSACYQCHTVQEVTDLNRQAHGDYDGDGSVAPGSSESTEGIQSEVQALLFLLSEKIKESSPNTFDPDSGTLEVSDNQYAPNTLAYASETAYRNASELVKRATWNYNLVASDRSYGVHNAAHIVRTLQQTFIVLGGDASTMEIRD